MKSAALVALFVIASMPTVNCHEMEPESNRGFLQNRLSILESTIASTSLRADSVAGSSPSIVTPSVTLSERMSNADPKIATSSDSAVSVFREGTTPESSPTTITAQSGASSSDTAVSIFREGTTPESSLTTITAHSGSGTDMHPTKVIGSESSISRPEPNPAAAAKPEPNRAAAAKPEPNPAAAAKPEPNPAAAAKPNPNTAARAAPHPAAAEPTTIFEVDPSTTIESDQNNVIKPGIVDSINRLPITVEHHSKPNPPVDQPDEPIKRKTNLETLIEIGLTPEDRLFNLGSILMSALVRSKVVTRFLTCSYRIISATIEARNNGSLPTADTILLQQYTNIGSLFHKYSIVSKLGHEVFEGPLWECFKDIAGGTLIFGYDELKDYINKFFDETKLFIEKAKPLDMLNNLFKLSADKEDIE